VANAARHGAPDAADIALALYQALRANGSAPPAATASSLGLTEAEAEVGWTELRQLGLLRTGGNAEEVDSVEPDTALMELLARQRETMRAQSEELSSVVTAAEALIDRYRPAVLREAAEIEVELVTNQNRRRQMVLDFAAAINKSVSSMHPGPLPSSEVLANSLESDRVLLERGVRVRAVYGQSINSAPRQRKYLTDLAATGVEVRLAGQVPFDLLIADSHTALVLHYPSDDWGPAVIVRGSALVRSYVAMYEDCWLRSAPFSASPSNSFEADGELTEQHRTTLRLLANGLTDERIARKLGVSLRTVSRLVSEVMRYLQAESRFQAGVLAANRGLI
jgi:DNA-binding NarL/FixJ family response regulator